VHIKHIFSLGMELLVLPPSVCFVPCHIGLLSTLITVISVNDAVIRSTIKNDPVEARISN
jgi:hypothetical protein